MTCKGEVRGWRRFVREAKQDQRGKQKRLTPVFDAEHNMVADQTSHILRIRGWGRISNMKNAANLQDVVGALIAEALTAAWKETP